MSGLTDTEIERYARQLILPEIGDDGQDALRKTRLCIVGAGGLGVPAALLAAAAGFGQLTIIDDDTIDATNLNRQFIYQPDQIGMAKAEVLAGFAAAQNPHITVTSQPHYCDEARAGELAATHDIIIDASDNIETRQRLNRACLRSQTPLIFVGAIRFEGQLMVIAPHLSDKGESACFSCVFPSGPDAAQAPNCATVGIAGPITTIMGGKAVLEAMKCAIGSPALLLDQLLLFDGLHYDATLIRTKKQAECPACSMIPS